LSTTTCGVSARRRPGSSPRTPASST
jgi:hypothetical protein